MCDSYVYTLYAMLAIYGLLVRQPCISVQTSVHTNRAPGYGAYCVKI